MRLKWLSTWCQKTFVACLPNRFSVSRNPPEVHRLFFCRRSNTSDCHLHPFRKYLRLMMQFSVIRSMGTFLLFLPYFTFFFGKSSEVCQKNINSHDASAKRMKETWNFTFDGRWFLCVALKKINKSSWTIEIIGVLERARAKPITDRHLIPTPTIVQPLPWIILCDRILNELTKKYTIFIAREAVALKILSLSLLSHLPLPPCRTSSRYSFIIVFKHVDFYTSTFFRS